VSCLSDESGINDLSNGLVQVGYSEDRLCYQPVWVPQACFQNYPEWTKPLAAEPPVDPSKFRCHLGSGLLADWLAEFSQHYVAFDLASVSPSMIAELKALAVG
jgi:hypothetical protein